MQPILVSERLRLRPYDMADASDVQRLAGERDVAVPTLGIPHPYPEGAAEQWISGHQKLFESGRGVTYAVTLSRTSQLLGAVSLLDLSGKHFRAEVGYWVGLEYWGAGYCTEALCRLMAFAEDHFHTTRFVGRCLSTNVASARVLVKGGFVPEGRQVGHVWSEGRFEDMLLFGRCCKQRGAG